MKKKTKAVLLSALVLPGLGQFKQRKIKRGIFFTLTFLGAITIFTIKIYKIVEKILQTIETDPNFVSSQQLINYTLNSLNDLDKSSFELLSYTILITWLSSIMDTFFCKQNR